ncbi:hypothetical protein SNE40_005337 [Patella caerulea]|uniref:Zinc finger CHCC-type domain-containing protein n=1 Tax=Patella caerulea TaxID=87958 RepID=A0AAN8PXB9_PATCE
MAALVRVCSRFSKHPALIRSISTTSHFLAADEGSHVDQKTHTGQVWDKDDYRRIRFIGKDKLINERFAIDLIAEDPVVVVEARHVWSDSGGPLGHPKVYINLDPPGIHSCGYSGRKFIQKKYYNEAEHGKSITYEEYLRQVRDGAQ